MTTSVADRGDPATVVVVGTSLVSRLTERAVRFVASMFPTDEIVQPDGTVYMRRFYVAHPGSRHIRFHHILASDDDRWLHDHPWNFVSLMLVGGYTETTEAGVRRLNAPAVNRLDAADLHSLALDGPVWTLVFTGEKVRDWGFATDAGWVPWQEYQNDNEVTARRPGRLFPLRPHARRKMREAATGPVPQVEALV